VVTVAEVLSHELPELVLSPELVLVDRDVRAAAIAALPERPWERFGVVDGPTPAHPTKPPAAHGMTPHQIPSAAVSASSGARLVAGLLVYAASQALLGVCLGLGVIIAVVLGVLTLSLFA
jgi:hypothetical protein